MKQTRSHPIPRKIQRKISEYRQIKAQKRSGATRSTHDKIHLPYREVIQGLRTSLESPSA